MHAEKETRKNAYNRDNTSVEVRDVQPDEKPPHDALLLWKTPQYDAECGDLVDNYQEKHNGMGKSHG